jgi:SAM-dependent methyltransferase
MLSIPEKDIRQSTPHKNLVRVLWQQWRTEQQLAQRGVNFRATAMPQVRSAYAAMSETEFDAINARQDWANWRTIPRALNGHVPEHPLRVLDLGCGTGSSTRVLAYYCPAGSRITGFEIAKPMLEIASQRDYRHRDGTVTKVDFVCQGVTQTLRQPDGEAIPDASVDLVNASGIVGHHLNAETFPLLLTELQRILKPTGIAMLDVGPKLGADSLRTLMQAAGFVCLGHYRSWFADPTGELVFQRKEHVSPFPPAEREHSRTSYGVGPGAQGPSPKQKVLDRT